MNALEELFAQKKTENGDDAYNTTGNHLIDLLFMSEYYGKHLNEVKIGTSDKEKLFAMFMRDGRFGLGRRDLGRQLMSQAEVSPEFIVKAGRFDDLIFGGNFTFDAIKYLKSIIKEDDTILVKASNGMHFEEIVNAIS